MEENENKDTINTEDANITTEPKFNKKKVIIISSIAGAVVIIGLMILLIFDAINKGKEIVEGVGSISNSIGDTIDIVANAEPTTPEPTTPEETTEPETTKTEIETIDPTADPFTAVAEGTYTDEAYETYFKIRTYENGAKRYVYHIDSTDEDYEFSSMEENLPEAVINDILAKMESEGGFGFSVGTTTGGSNTETQKPTKVTIVEPPVETQTQKTAEQETPTQAPKEDKGGTFDKSTGKLTLWGEDMLYYKSTIFGEEQYIPWEDYKEQIKTVEIKNGMKEICDSAFGGCTNLQSITIPNSVTTIGNSAFSGCTNLQSITIPNSVTTIGSSAFYECEKLKSIVIPEGVTKIDKWTFWGCSSLTDIKLPSTLTTIETCAFRLCKSLENIDIPDNVSTMGNSVFECCTSLKNIDVPRSITYIPYGTYSGCSGLTEVTIPSWVETIENNSFDYCTNISSFVISDGVKTINCPHFRYDYDDTKISVYIPESVTTIDWENAIVGKEYMNIYTYVIKGSAVDNYLIEQNYIPEYHYHYYE